MSWSFHVEPGGLVWPDPGPERPQLREALQDCVPSLSPAGTAPSLSTYWIDRILAGLSPGKVEARIANGNAWSLVRKGAVVEISFDHADDEARESIQVDELATAMAGYRHAVVRAIEGGHSLDDRWWAQKNPG